MPTSTNTPCLLGWWNCLFVSAKQTEKLLIQLLFVPRHCNRAASPTYLVHQGLLQSLSISYWDTKHHQVSFARIWEKAPGAASSFSKWDPHRDTCSRSRAAGLLCPAPRAKWHHSWPDGSTLGSLQPCRLSPHQRDMDQNLQVNKGS